MEENQYLIPANSKKSMLILGYFTAVDLVVFLMGVAFTLILLFLVQTSTIKLLILVILPGLISALLVLPVPHYHNVMQLLTNFYDYYTKSRMYCWKGWCATSEEEN
ncbi:MAG: hypothetical protein IKX00_04620 [Bacilli bacterium]|nr:hypothetical protein [Bacilli bacterium]